VGVRAWALPAAIACSALPVVVYGGASWIGTGMFEHIPFTTKQFTPPKQRQVIQEWQGPATTKSQR
jgi:hypothetical protein